MTALVAVATRHGSSLEIAEAIAATLRAGGVSAVVSRVEAVSSLAGHDAVVLGSAVYAGHWLRAARDFVDRHEATLRELPVWVFSTGPLGDPPRPAEEPPEVEVIATRVGAVERRTFAGKAEGSQLGLAEKALMALVRAPYGDFRPWSEVVGWAESIAQQLRPASAAAAGTTGTTPATGEAAQAQDA
jgi:menaquinone-dependent protoporphyrinogen oxidase